MSLPPPLGISPKLIGIDSPPYPFPPYPGISPKQIGILVVNCSLFNPTPSLSAMIINHFKMRSNIISYNLSGKSEDGLD